MKRIYSICLIVLLCLFQVTPALASVSTSSNWFIDYDGSDLDVASSSDWYFTPFDWGSYYQNFGVAPFAIGSVPTFTPTVSYSAIVPQMSYYDMSNVVHYINAELDSGGHFSFTRPSDYVKPRNLTFYINSTSLPRPGKYLFQFRIGSNTPMTVTSAYVSSQKNTGPNVAYLLGTSQSVDFITNGSDVYVSQVIDLGSSLSFLSVRFDVSSFTFNISCDVKARFEVSSSSPGYTTVGGSQTSQDIQQGIADSAGQIADNTAAIDGTLKQLIQHISDQLHALWDQMYNYMHVPLVNNDNARTQRIIDRLDEGFDINVEVLDRNFHDLMANDDKNTNTVVNGFDNSKFNSANNQLQTSIDVYDKTETDIFDSVKGDITGFQIPDFTSNVQVLAAVGFSSNYLQRLFNAIGLFNLPVTVSLVMIFVLMVLGYYRVRN